MAVEHVDTKGQLRVQAEVWHLTAGSQDPPPFFFSYPTIYLLSLQLMWKHGFLCAASGDSKGQSSPTCLQAIPAGYHSREGHCSHCGQGRGDLLTINLLHPHQGLEYMSVCVRKFHVPKVF